MNKGIFLIWFGSILLSLFIIGLIVYACIWAFTSGSETIIIKDKWVKYNGDDAKYLVSSEDGQVFQITDSLVRGRWDSSNLYAKLNAGEICEIQTQGFRFPFMSDYKNIIEATCYE